MYDNFFRDKLEAVNVFYSEYRREVVLFGIFLLVASSAFAVGYLAAGELGRAPIEISACNILDGGESPARVLASNIDAGDVPGESGLSSSSHDTISAVIEAEPIAKRAQVPKEKPATVWCGFSADSDVSTKPVIINEMAWMGAKGDSADEWIELKNIMPINVDLEGWQLQDKAGQIKIDLSGKVLAPGRILVLARNEARLGLWADMAYTGTLSNSNEEIKLFDKDCALVDSAKAGSSWPAGDNKEKRSMERDTDLSWHTYNGSGQIDSGFIVMGTPGRENSLPPSETGDAAAVSPAVVQEDGEDSLNLEQVTQDTSEECQVEQIDINSAAKEDLVRVQHIGSARADQIIDKRPFVSFSDFEQSIDGISQGRLEDILAEGLACLRQGF